jgi:hypothetical protein
MPGCQPCAPADGVFMVSVRVLEYLCCLCGRHVACLLLSDRQAEVNKQHGGHKDNTNILTHGHWQ